LVYFAQSLIALWVRSRLPNQSLLHLKDTVRASTPGITMPPPAEMPRASSFLGCRDAARRPSSPNAAESPHQWRPSFSGCRDVVRPSTRDLAPWPPTTLFLPRLQGCDYPTNGNGAVPPPHAARGLQRRISPHVHQRRRSFSGCKDATTPPTATLPFLPHMLCAVEIPRNSPTNGVPPPPTAPFLPAAAEVPRSLQHQISPHGHQRHPSFPGCRDATTAAPRGGGADVPATCSFHLLSFL
jgi:hypothetical protein